MIRSLSCATIFAGLAMTSIADAQVNKCVDANGKTIYSQAPCPTNTKSSNLRPKPVAPATAVSSDGKADAKAAAKSSAPKTAAELEQEFRKRRTEQDEAAKKSQDKVAEAKTREENCKASRNQLANLESGARQARIDESGERTFLNDEQIAREVERARTAVQNWCK